MKGELFVLNDIKVLSFTHFLQGPSSVQMLADLGANVIKIEQTKGAYERSWSGFDSYKNDVSVFFMLANRNQRSLALDLRTDEGKELIYKLVEESDVLVENFRPGSMDKLGLSYERLKAINPKLIYCSCTGYGSDGPYNKKPGQDLLLQSISGLMTLTGKKEDPPTPIGTAAVDQHGAVLAAFGIVSALYEREKTKIGKKVDVSLLNAALDLQIEPLAYYMNNGELWERSNTGLASRFHQAPYGVYKTKDGWITVSNTSIEKFAKILKSEALSKFSPEDQMSNKRYQIDKIFSDIIKEEKTEYWENLFTDNNIWYALVNDYETVINDPQIKWNGMITTTDHPKAGRVKLLNHPVLYNGKAVTPRLYPPALGEHSKEILNSHGYSESQINEMIEKGIIACNSWNGDDKE